MRRLGTWWLWIRLKYFLRKGFRSEIPLGNKESWNNDDVIVRYQQGADTSDEIVDAIEGGSFQTVYFDRNQGEHRNAYSLNEATAEQFSVRHFYAVWRIEYDSLNEAFFKVLLRANYLRVLALRRYDKGLRERRDLHELLNVLIDLRQRGDEPTISIARVLEALYGPPIRIAGKGYDFKKRLVFMLSALEASGNVKLEPDAELPAKVELLPIALKTAGDFEVEASRHRDSLKVTRYQLLVAIAMLLVAVAALSPQCGALSSTFMVGG